MSLLASLAAFLFLAGRTSAVGLEVPILLIVHSGVAEGKITLVARREGATEEAVEFQVGPGSSRLALPGDAVWSIKVASDRVWSAERVWPRDAVDGELTLELYPAALITGTLVSDNPLQDGPLEVRLESSRAPGRGSIPRTTEECAVSRGEFRCVVPAAALDLRLRHRPFVPIYLWGRELEEGINDLGELPLAPGASVVGWVETWRGDAPPIGTRVVLQVPVFRQATHPETARRIESLRMEQEATEQGFFQFAGVPPGFYAVAASAAGYAPATRDGVEAREALEAEIFQPLVLRQPASLEARFDPPRPPFGGRWNTQLYRRNRQTGQLSKQTDASASDLGELLLSDLPVGDYVLMASDEDNSRWVEEEIELASGENFVPIDVPLVEVSGTVRFGRERVAGKLWFGGRSAARRILIQSDLNGQFVGFLPEEGDWKIDLEWPEERLVVGLDPVEVRVPEGQRRAELDLRLPNTQLRGQVVDEDDTPVGQATVDLVPRVRGREGGTNRVETLDDGSFRLVGIPPGPVSVQAASAIGESSWFEVTLSEDFLPAPLRLVLRQRREVQVRILAQGRPVPGAQVLSLPGRLGAGSVGVGGFEVADPRGLVSLELPAGTDLLTLVTMAPSYALSIGQHVTHADPEISVNLDASGGNLLLAEPRPQGILAHNGAAVPLVLLQRWVQIQGGGGGVAGVMSLRNVEPGQYAYCSSLHTFVESLGSDSPPSGCSTGVLGPFGELVLGLD